MVSYMGRMLQTDTEAGEFIYKTSRLSRKRGSRKDAGSQGKNYGEPLYSMDVQEKKISFFAGNP